MSTNQCNASPIATKAAELRVLYARQNALDEPWSKTYADDEPELAAITKSIWEAEQFVMTTPANSAHDALVKAAIVNSFIGSLGDLADHVQDLVALASSDVVRFLLQLAGPTASDVIKPYWAERSHLQQLEAIERATAQPMNYPAELSH